MSPTQKACPARAPKHSSSAAPWSAGTAKIWSNGPGQSVIITAGVWGWLGTLNLPVLNDKTKLQNILPPGYGPEFCEKPSIS